MKIAEIFVGFCRLPNTFRINLNISFNSFFAQILSSVLTFYKFVSLMNFAKLGGGL